MEILYRDRALVIAVKPVGVESEQEMPRLLAEALGVPACHCVHRLDREVGGVMAYALTPKAAASLTQAFSSHDTRKEYLAAAWGTLPEGELRDLLFHDRRTNKTFVTDRQRAGVKEAVLLQRTEQTAQLDGQPISLLRVTLLTGRSHQIRVQLASRKHPLLGDRRYGSSVRCPGIALWSAAL